MAITRQKKEEIVQDVHKKMEDSKVLVFVNFHGLSMDKMSNLRKALRSVGAEFKVAKKRLVKRVVDGFGVEGEAPKLEGEVAVAFGKDEVVVPQTLSKFKKNEKGIEILGGVLENKYIDASIINQLASIPPYEQLLQEMVGSIAAPLQGFANVLLGPARNIINVLRELSQKSEL